MKTNEETKQEIINVLKGKSVSEAKYLLYELLRNLSEKAEKETIL